MVSEIWMKISTFSFTKNQLKMLSAKWLPLSTGLNVMNTHISATENNGQEWFIVFWLAEKKCTYSSKFKAFHLLNHWICNCNLQSISVNHLLGIDILNISFRIEVRLMPQCLINDQSTDKCLEPSAIKPLAEPLKSPMPSLSHDELTIDKT